MLNFTFFDNTGQKYWRFFISFCAQEKNSEPILPEFQKFLINKKLVLENTVFIRRITRLDTQTSKMHTQT